MAKGTESLVGGLTVDEERGWVFLATGSPAPDFIGTGGDAQGRKPSLPIA